MFLRRQRVFLPGGIYWTRPPPSLAEQYHKRACIVTLKGCLVTGILYLSGLVQRHQNGNVLLE
jgi:hypothetical protein